MTEYIEREAAYQTLTEYYHHTTEGMHSALRDALNRVPAADVRPVVRGEWSVHEIYKHELSYGATAYEPVYECSACGGWMESYLRYDEPIMPEDADFPRFCPNCGARMEGSE